MYRNPWYGVYEAKSGGVTQLIDIVSRWARRSIRVAENWRYVVSRWAFPPINLCALVKLSPCRYCQRCPLIVLRFPETRRVTWTKCMADSRLAPQNSRTTIPTYSTYPACAFFNSRQRLVYFMRGSGSQLSSNSSVSCCAWCSCSRSASRMAHTCSTRRSAECISLALFVRYFCPSPVRLCEK